MLPKAESKRVAVCRNGGESPRGLPAGTLRIYCRGNHHLVCALVDKKGNGVA